MEMEAKLKVASSEVTNTYRLQPVMPTNDLRIIVGIICSLSIVGSLLIIISYICFKSLRTTTRLILVHLSIMDLGVATANLVGISVNFNKYYFNSTNATYGLHGLPVLNHPGHTVDMACKIQAAFAVYFTAGSFLWTLSMAVYIYMRIVHYRTPTVARNTLWIVTIFSYILPLIFVSWKWFTNRLGYSTFSAEGWCGDRVVDIETGESQLVLSVLSYDLLIWLNYILVPVLYITVLLFLYQEMKQSAMFVSSERFWKAVYSLDFKLLLIPLAFLLLRIWSFLDDLSYIYAAYKLPLSAHYVIFYLAGIGDSGQGFVNAILFVLLTKKVRQKIFPCCNNKCCKGTTTEESPLLEGSIQQRQDKSYSRENTPHLMSSSFSSSHQV